ncbi:MAG: hypothetical protein CSA33_04400 [Desulfobulbus propionicus]|nr:MAG: hypothetical protein CSA33_04400 [Desulfobulbus propionicus]
MRPESSGAGPSWGAKKALVVLGLVAGVILAALLLAPVPEILEPEAVAVVEQDDFPIVKDMSEPNRTAYKILLKEELWGKKRAGKVKEEQVVAAAPWSLVGITTFGDRKTALIQTKGVIRRHERGDRLSDGWVIEEILDDQVEITAAEGRRSVRLYWPAGD